MKHVTIYTDGSCKGNPGPGGYAAILQYEDAHGRRHEKVISGGIAQTTNNRAEATAAIQALSALKEPCQAAGPEPLARRVDLCTDSQYLVTVTTGGKARANLDLVTELRALMARHRVTVHHVEGHNGHPVTSGHAGLGRSQQGPKASVTACQENERANRLAQEAAVLQAQANRAVAESRRPGGRKAPVSHRCFLLFCSTVGTHR